MSWMSQNYHKVALGGGVLALLGLGYLGNQSTSAATQKLVIEGVPPKSDVSVDGGKEAKEVVRSVKEPDVVEPPVGAGRTLHVLSSVPLFVPKGDLDTVEDILADGAREVHPGIKNSWWVEYGVDPGYANSPERDHDGDGYSNREEYDYETNPADKKSYPALVHKLEVVKIDTRLWYIMLNSVLGNDNFQFKYLDKDKNGKRNEIRMRADDNVKVGQIFFKDEPAVGRFKLIDIKEREGKRGRKEKVAVVLDQKDNKKEEFEAYFRPKDDLLKKSYRFDDEVHFRLNAVGQSDKVQKVETNTEFKVTVDGKTRTYKLLEVKRSDEDKPLVPTEVIVEYTKEDGSKGTREVSVKK